MMQKLRFGTLYQVGEDKRPAAVTRLSNEANLHDLVQCYRVKGYQSYFVEAVKAAQAKLVSGLREGNVEVAEDDEAHLLHVCGVRCCEANSCIHTLSKDGLLLAEGPLVSHVWVLSEEEQQRRMIVACDPIQTKLRDDSLECFPRSSTDVVVRIHLFYPGDMPCGSIHDCRGRLVTQKQFVPRNTRSWQSVSLFDHVSRNPRAAPPPPHEAMFPFTPNTERYVGFTTDRRCAAITVETVFVRDASRQQRPFYTEDTAQTRVYVSHLRASELITDDELTAQFPEGSLDAMAMPAFTDNRDEEKFNVLVRLYLLAHDQGWTATLTGRSPHPLHDPQRPVLFRSVSVKMEVADRWNPWSPTLLKQKLHPDVEGQIMRFCFRRVVSEALRRRVVARGADGAASPHVPVVCYLPFGDRTPVFTNAQIGVLAALYPTLNIRRPASAADWAALSRTLYQHGVPLLDILQAVGTPLRDATGANIVTDTYVPYTADMAASFFLVIANRPLRDYTCVVNQRWLLEDLLGRRCLTATTPAAFAAWVRYWNTMVQLKNELMEQLSTDIVSAHLGQRLPSGVRSQAASCLVNGCVTDDSGGLLFAALCGRRFKDKAHVGHLPAGTAVVYLFWRNGRKLCYMYVPRPYSFVQALPELNTDGGVARETRGTNRSATTAVRGVPPGCWHERSRGRDSAQPRATPRSGAPQQGNHRPAAIIQAPSAYRAMSYAAPSFQQQQQPRQQAQNAAPHQSSMNQMHTSQGGSDHLNTSRGRGRYRGRRSGTHADHPPVYWSIG